VIARLNRQFVCTSIIIDDLQARAAGGDPFAKRLADEWVYPVEMIFLTPSGQVVSKLNSYEDFPGVHPDVAAPPHGQHRRMTDEHLHKDVFMSRLAQHFGK
jgi:hypothetical protein